MESAPVLSTPDTQIFDYDVQPTVERTSRLSEEQLRITYDIQRTVAEIRRRRWHRVALQFPDAMLKDAPRVIDALQKDLSRPQPETLEEVEQGEDPLASQVASLSIADPTGTEVKLFILGDTSYGSCCVDEVAAEHLDADSVVHYGRGCLSPTARLPVLHIFTVQPLILESVISTFKMIYPDAQEKVVLMADMPLMTHLDKIYAELLGQGYKNVQMTSVVHDPSALLPNRALPTAIDSAEALQDYSLFHIGDPPTALLLTVSARAKNLNIYSIDADGSTLPSVAQGNASATLRRRYGLVTSLSTVSVFGILINTLSVRNYMDILEYVKKQIAAAGKKSYTFVVGKINAAKVANFSEIGGWVVIGCWESSLIENQEFWRPIITPFELDIVLKSDEERVWTGQWSSDYQTLLNKALDSEQKSEHLNGTETASKSAQNGFQEDISDDESAPPEFDLRSGRYVSHSRPMAPSNASTRADRSQNAHPNKSKSTSLVKRANGDIAQIGGIVSPGAEFLRGREWQGLGSDFNTEQDGLPLSSELQGGEMEEGRGGVARGYSDVVTTYPPILESLFANLPTTSIIALSNTSSYLRDFLRKYPLAWRSLSFRLPHPLVSGSDNTDNTQRQARQCAFDGLLTRVLAPVSTRLTSLDLCNTAVSGVTLVARVLEPRLDTLEHLSVRGCKNVSIKYHILPFLQSYSPKHSPWARPGELKLKSLYTYRCRHHRRRPYLPSSLIRKDSDSEPTHELIELCHDLNIWTDSAWCTTPGQRCFRRKNYYTSHATPGTQEIWVPFDRLWRSQNRIGPSAESKPGKTDNWRLWEDKEIGYNGEPLGTVDEPHKGESKLTPSHLRTSHKIFVDNVRCDKCGDQINERCEQCSVQMHCMGCRRTLCGSCAFNRPLPRKRKRSRPTLPHLDSFGMPFLQSNKYWWAPETVRSPNHINENAPLDDSDSDDDDTQSTGGLFNSPVKLSMHWCCLEPIFSGGGGIVFLGPALGGDGAEKIRSVPLPNESQYKDPDFSPKKRWFAKEALQDHVLWRPGLDDEVDILPFLKQDKLDLQATTSPRSLCQDCFDSKQWQVKCRACMKPLCKEHDFRVLKIRKCGFRDLHTEREFVRNYRKPTVLEIPPYHTISRLRARDSSPSSNMGSMDGSEMDTDVATDSRAPTLMSSSQFDEPITASRETIEAPKAGSSALIPRGRMTPLRPRSMSLSGFGGESPYRSRQTQYTGLNEDNPLPCSPRHPVQWEGCGSYFCQQQRPMGDTRARCMAMVRECTECKVHVCQDCSMNIPRCSCQFCMMNYYCPNCTQKPGVRARCRKEAEEEERCLLEAQARARKTNEAEERKKADELVEAVAWLFTSLEDSQAQGEEPGPAQDAGLNGLEDGVVEVLDEMQATYGGAPQ
ncbi:diphthamide biosynthesis protein [Eremomyces bilateralis CBS 781.70]|uniref:S-adenosyl-L-methionine:L-histidine 3-amino-3-carboxypropyltransferase 2 n=1 Tax=Eremomyces bilateralis CBS 781.70 TaxID=1392243 RepID=A0A6G1G5X2_9PEZI|nr:diphthamide biosynthesis protein [Eremomyces bilateralis CBS 781.70]KAF1813444.1 diphthamide biosynthesis protein [Eremomyces bilateralis CBS 781.70]